MRETVVSSFLFNNHLKLKIMMTIFTRDYSHRLRHSNKKQDNNAVKTETIGNTAEVARFDKWFTSSYTRLKNKIASFSTVDEDTFHNTYLFVRKKIMYSEERIEDFEAYFFGCYKVKNMVSAREEQRYTYPGDEFFLRFAEEEHNAPREKLTRCDKLAKDVLRYIRCRFSNREYEMFILRYYRQQCSLKVLSEYTGLPLSEVMRKTRRMLESLRANSYFMERCEMLYVYE